MNESGCSPKLPVQAEGQRAPRGGLRGWFGRQSIRVKINAITLVYVTIILSLLAIAAFASSLNNGVRAFAQGESLWSKAQKDAVHYLMRYAQLRDENDYQKYLREIAIPLGDRAGRLELHKPSYDYAVVERGFVAGGNAPEDVPYMVSLYRRFHNIGDLKRAIAIWNEADVQILQLIETADQIHAAITAGRLSAQRERQLLDRVEQINARLTPIEIRFTATLGEAARRMRVLVLMVIVGFALALLGGGLALSTWISRQLRTGLMTLRAGTRRVAEGDLSLQIPVTTQDEIGDLTLAFNDMIAHRRRAEGQLKHTLSVLSTTLESTADGIIVVDLAGRIVCFNQRFVELWEIPKSVMLTGDGNLVQLEVARKFEDPEAFLNKFRALYAAVEQESFELLQLKDGRVFERNSRPQRIDGTVIGRVCSFRDVTERKQAEAHIQKMAHHDALTQLPNRALLMDRLDMALEQARRNGSLVALLMLDLDHFKNINDSLGHSAGDQLLRTVAARLSGCARKTDTVARMGGDEFVIVLTDVKNRDTVERIVQAMVEEVSAPIVIESHELVVTPSIGISVFPDDGAHATGLLKSADTAMYQAKAQGRGNYQWFAPRMMLAVDERLELEHGLRRALERREFSLDYQPLVSIKTGQVVGSEALIRWHHPRRGTVLPRSFIPLAEETGLIIPIGAWVLRQACIEGKRLQAQLGKPLIISVNISTRQFRQDNLLRTVEDVLEESGLPPHTLVLEITESALAANPQETAAVLKNIRDLGVRIAVDDFGTGYSSLSYITRFPIDLLKIDASFVRDLIEDQSDAAITSAIIALAHSLKLEVVAEGVETQAQLAFLRERVCNEAQGFYFGKPVPAAQFSTLAGQIDRAANDGSAASALAGVG
ncbi:MAG: EAL domain-containing protein [Pseudomonadota bacterium]